MVASVILAAKKGGERYLIAETAADKDSPDDIMEGLSSGTERILDALSLRGCCCSRGSRVT